MSTEKTFAKEHAIALGRRLKEIRNKLGMGQKVMAEQFGVSFSTWRRFEKGEASPSALLISKLISFSYDRGVPFDPQWLLGGKRVYSTNSEVPEVLEDFVDWTNACLAILPEHKDWLAVELRRHFPDFVEWIASGGEKIAPVSWVQMKPGKMKIED